ncbi:MAG: MFS transporter [Bacteroidales bacterium]|nr:MFS transporter [Bacteroidales bacterium]
MWSNAFDLRPNQGLPMPLIVALSVMAGISVANIYYCQPLLNMIREDTGLSVFEVNLMPVFTQIGYALGLLFIIPLGDLYNRRKTILASFLAAIAALLVIAARPSATGLLAASFVVGIASVSPQVFIPFVLLYAKPEQKERKAGIVLSGLLVGILASRVVSGYVGHAMGWRTMYVIAAAIMTLSALVILRIFPNVTPTYRGTFASLMKSIRQLAVRYPRSLLYALRSAFAFGSLLGMWGCMAFRMKEAPFFADSDTVGLLGLCGVAGALTASNVGKYIPRYGVERINAFGVALILLAWIIMGTLDNTYAGMIAGIVIIDIGMQSIQLSNQSATMRLCPEATSRMNTIYMVTYFIGGSFGTFIAGTMWSLFGWSGTVGAGIALILCSVLITLGHRAFRKRTSQETKDL